MKKLTIGLLLTATQITIAQVTDTGDKVGVGISSPISKLEVNYGVGSSTVAGLRIFGGGGVYENIALSLDDTGTASNNINILEFKNSSVRSAIIKSINPSGSNSSGGNLVLETTSNNTGSLNSNQLFLKNNGKVGIGTSDPKYRLSVSNGKFNVEKNGDYYGFWVDDKLRTDNPKINLGSWYNVRAGIAYNSIGNYLTFDTQSSTVVNANVLVLKGSKVGIGTTTPDSKLTVAGKVHAQEVKVTITAGADFVFEDTYQPPTLKELESFIKTNKHLPEIASAKEMESEGLELGVMNVKLLQKIEELTLYTIEQERRLDEQAKAINKLQEKFKK